MASEIKVTNIKAKDGTAGLSIANSTGNIDIGTVTAGNLSNASIVYPKGHWDWLASGAIVTSGSPAVSKYTFTGATADYNNYRIIVEDLLQGATRGKLKLNIIRASDDALITSTSYKNEANFATDAGAGAYSNASGTFFILSDQNIGGGNVAYFDIVVFNLIKVAAGFDDNYCGISWQGFMGGEGKMETVSGGGQLNDTQDRSGFEVGSGAGGTLNGQVTVFGQRAYI